jgi:hypothetical protein
MEGLTTRCPPPLAIGQAATCLLSPTCLGLGSDVIGAFEGGLVGLHRNDLATQPAQVRSHHHLPPP